MWKQRLTLFIIASLVALVPFYWSGGLPTSPDSAGLVCAAEQRLAGISSQPSYHGFDFYYQPCWRYSVYPGNQLITTALAWLLGGQALLSMVVLSIVLFAACVTLLFDLAIVITKQTGAGWCVGLLAVGSLPLWRSLILTPQNTYGYFFIILIAWCLARISTTHRKKPLWPLVGVALSIAGLSMFHVLSLAVAGVALALYTLIALRKHPLWLIAAAASLTLAASGVGAWHYQTWNPIELYNVITQLTIHGSIHSWADHPAVWGYLPTLLALSTLWLLLDRQLKLKLPGGLYLLLIGVVAVIGAHPELTGLNILPERFITFAWIPITVFGGISLFTITRTLPRWSVIAVCCLLFTGMFVHTASYATDIYTGITEKYLPSAQFAEAMTWLEDHRSDTTFVVGVAGMQQREMAFSGLWYHGDSAWYPWYRLNHKDIYTLSSSDGVFKDIVNESTHPQHQALADLHQILTVPQSKAARAAVQQYGITHVVLRRSSPLTMPWPVVFENNDYLIYASPSQ